MRKLWPVTGVIGERREAMSHAGIAHAIPASDVHQMLVLVYADCEKVSRRDKVSIKLTINPRLREGMK